MKHISLTISHSFVSVYFSVAEIRWRTLVRIASRRDSMTWSKYRNVYGACTQPAYRIFDEMCTFHRQIVTPLRTPFEWKTNRAKENDENVTNEIDSFLVIALWRQTPKKCKCHYLFNRQENFEWATMHFSVRMSFETWDDNDACAQSRLRRRRRPRHRDHRSLIHSFHFTEFPYAQYFCLEFACSFRRIDLNIILFIDERKIQ